jgi:Mak10 subunit, NatC N(alpha)-terminal acetyltransferase
MVHSNLFSLYESMSAIEIYDPKMDLKSNLKDCVTLESALKKEIIKKPENLTAQEVKVIKKTLKSS